MIALAAEYEVSEECKMAYWLGWDMAEAGHDTYSSPMTIPLLTYYWKCGHQDFHNPDVREPYYPKPEKNPTWTDDGF